MATNTDTQVDKPVDLKMTAQEFADLRAMVLKVQDNTLQPILLALVLHMGRTHGFDAAVEDKRLAKEAQDRADKQRETDEADQAERDKEAAAAAQKAKNDLFVSMFGTNPPAAVNTSATVPSVTPVVKPTPAPATTPDPKSAA